MAKDISDNSELSDDLRRQVQELTQASAQE